MTDPDLDLTRAREAWQNASPAELTRGLNSPEDYPPAVRAIIQEVAERRGIEADCEDAAVPETFVSVRRAASRIRPRLRALLPVVQSHPFFSGIGLGILTYICGTAPRFIFEIAGFWPSVALSMFFFVFLRLGGIIVICLPMRRYHTVILATLGASLSEGVISALSLSHYAARSAPGAVSAEYLYSTAINFAAGTAVIFSILGFVVWIRNRYFPIPEPGRCRVCEYDLRGLPEPRCPECGTPFDPSEVVLPSPGDAT